MKRLAIVTAILALAAPLAMAQASTWVSDPGHSEVTFTITHLTITNVHGTFGHVTATLNYNQADVTKANVTAMIDVSTVNTNESKRDEHLKTDAFFDVAKFPTATFTSTKVTKTSDGLSIAGNLTLHGVTKPVVLIAQGPTGPIQGRDKKTHAGFSASTTISRSAFGIGPNYPAAALGDDVRLSIDLDFVEQ